MTSQLTRAYWIAYQRFMVDPHLRQATTTYLDAEGSDAQAHDIATEELLRGVVANRQSARSMSDRLKIVSPNDSYERLLAQWLAVPPTTREDMRALSAGTVRPRGSTLVRTGGSTGEPVGVVISKQGFKGKRSRLLAARTAVGWYPGMPTFSIWGSERDIGNSESFAVRAQRRAAGIHFDSGLKTSADRWHRLADLVEQKTNGIALYGYSSLLGDFAETLQRDNRPLRTGLVSAVWNGAEPVDARTRSAIEYVTGRRLHDFYGARETGAIAVELHGEGAPGLTVVGPQIILEVVDAEGQLVEPGEIGKVLVSVLEATGTPILRYEIGDSARAGTRAAFGHRTITELVGRTNDSIPLPGGGSVYGIFFNHLIKDFESVTQFQVLVDTSIHEIEVRAMTTASATYDNELDSLRAMVAAKIPGYKVEVARVTHLERTPHGKLRQVIVR